MKFFLKSNTVPDLPEFIELPADKTVKDLVATLDRPYSLKVWTGRVHHGIEKPLAHIDGDTLTLYKATGLTGDRQAVLRLKRGNTNAPRNRVAAALLQGQEIVT